MIDPRDLMIWNYIEYDNKIYYIQDISMFQGRYVSNLFKSMYDSFPYFQNKLIKDFKPILITEKWLIDLGFKKWEIKKGNEITYSNGHLILHKRKRGWVIHKKRKEPKYIHELQNIGKVFYDLELINININVI